MEQRFGHDFSQVRVHADQRAGDAARAFNSLAFTVGSDIFFDSARYSPSTLQGQKLLAHELTHVVQQTVQPRSSVTTLTPEQEAHNTAGALSTGYPVQVSPGAVLQGQPQFYDGASSAGHTGTKLPTPEEYIKQHTNFMGLNLLENKLAGDLYLLVWQSKGHLNFVLKVFKALDSENQTEVAEAFFKQLGGDSWLKEMALTPDGRSFLTTVASFLPEDNAQRKRVTKIVAEGPQEEREKERKEALEGLKKRGKNVDMTFYTEYKGMDTAEAILGIVARNRLKTKRTDAAFPMAQFEDIQAYLDAIAQKTGATDFVRELHLMGHGTKDNFGFGEYYYSSEFLRKNYATSLNAKYMANGATIYMEGCNIAKGEAGRLYLKEIGRIFFGDKKSGYIKGNTCTVVAIGEITECGPRTFRWPSDFK